MSTRGSRNKTVAAKAVEAKAVAATKADQSESSAADFSGKLCHLLYNNSLNGVDTDVMLKVGPDAEVFHAHYVVLKGASTVFDTMFSGRWKNETTEDTNGKTVYVQSLPKDNPEDFRTLLKLMYGFTKLEVSTFEQLLPVVSLADKYEATMAQEVLSEYCKDLAAAQLTVENVVKIYLSAKKFGIAVVVESALQFMIKNINDLWKSEEGWLSLDQEAVITILSNETLCHYEAKKAFLSCNFNCKGSCCSTCSNSNQSPQNRYESKNEALILGKAMEWIKRKRTSTAALDQGFDALKVLSNIRFHQMSQEDYKEAVQKAPGILKRNEIEKIVFAMYRASLESDDDSSFVPTSTRRVPPEVAKPMPDIDSHCSNCGHRNFKHVNGRTYRCSYCNREKQI